MSDSRIPDDRQECQPGGMIGLDGTSYADWAIMRELDGSYALLHNGLPTTTGYGDVSAALDAIDAARATEGPADQAEKPDGE